MPGAFDYFVILADMRTGSNLLEESLDAYDGLSGHGEVFNPVFAGREGQPSLFGMTVAERDRNPLDMLARMRAASDGTPGFRLFPGHDPRVFDHCLMDPQCAKVILARNPVESYVSLKIARKTGQWWLGDMRTARSAIVRFEPAEFDAYVRQLQDFYGRIRRSLQISGQTAFHVHYDDLSDPAIRDGLARWLGATGAARHNVHARVQNPGPLETKVENFAEMEAALGRADAFDLYRHPDLEPRRGPNVPGWIASDDLGLLFLPLAGGPTDRVVQWFRAAAGGSPPQSGFSRKSLHQWMRDRPGHRKFTVVCHPLRRAHDVFLEKIVSEGPDSFTDIRAILCNRYGLDIPAAEEEVEPARHRAAFLGFLRFLKGNLSGQTSVRVPAAWASQSALVAAMGEVAPPDLVLRAETLDAELARLRPAQVRIGPEGPTHLARIYDRAIEDAARAAYSRDYMTFGYGDWQ
jgi:LPS sulfotransferase NodH